MQIAAVVLGLAALGGLTLAVIRLKGTPIPPTWLALGHGAIAATGLGILAYHVATQAVPALAQYALGGFVLAALGGATLFFGFHMRGKPLPVAFILGHGAIAVTSYVMLLLALYR